MRIFSFTMSFSLSPREQPILDSLLDDLRDGARPDRPAALADGEAHALLHRNRRDQLHLQVHVVPRHHHLRTTRQRRYTRHVRRPEVKLRPVTVEKRRVPATLL